MTIRKKDDKPQRISFSSYNGVKVHNKKVLSLFVENLCFLSVLFCLYAYNNKKKKFSKKLYFEEGTGELFILGKMQCARYTYHLKFFFLFLLFFYQVINDITIYFSGNKSIQ